MRMIMHFLLGLLTGGIWWVWLVVRYFINK